MARLVALNGQQVSRSERFDRMEFHSTKWLDLENPSDAELDQVAGIVRLPKRDLKNAIDRDEVPRVVELDHFTMVVCKSPLAHERRDHVSTTSVSMLVSERLLITIHRDPVKSVTDLLVATDEELLSLLRKGTSELLQRLIEDITNDFYIRLDEVEVHIDKIEDSVFEKPEQRMVKRIFALKRTLIYFHKALAANRDVLITLQKDGTGAQIKNKVQKRMTHLYYDMVQLIDVVATYRDILTGTLDIYLSAVSNNMNAVMKKMTAYGSLVLVPTFITGLYGMNFRFMPEIDWRLGYAFAWGLILISITLLYIHFKREDWF
ncbi:magnesium/cobalt transporter CorA [Candidatus Woesearchaeota archaeon]|nr:magnesium/cobalt transporter CorA [Candidatus Woesearchaeota archaeon]